MSAERTCANCPADISDRHHNATRCAPCQRAWRVSGRRPKKARKTWQHGTLTGYSFCGCRCDECRAFGKAYRAKRREDPGLEHGTTAALGCGCRCDECRNARREYERAYRSRNRSTVTAKRHASYIENREKVLDQSRAYYEANLDQVRSRHRAYDEVTGYHRLRRAPGGKRYESQLVAAALASRSGKPWTADDNAVALDSTLTDVEKALRLGRTLYSIRAHIWRLNARSVAA